MLPFRPLTNPQGWRRPAEVVKVNQENQFIDFRLITLSADNTKQEKPRFILLCQQSQRKPVLPFLLPVTQTDLLGFHIVRAFNTQIQRIRVPVNQCSYFKHNNAILRILIFSR